jgi:hypothetical protein
MGLPSIMALASLLFLVILILLGTTLSSHGAVCTLENKTRARNLAEAAVKRSCLRLRSQPDFGLKAEDGLTVILAGNPAGAEGRVAFQGPTASLNNLAGQAARADSRGLPVPAQSALLIGLGRCRSVEVRVEVLLHRAAFPYVLASQGPVESSGATRIGALNPVTEELLPGDLACNSGLDQAVQLGPQSFVSGDLRSAGGVVLDPQATVAGQTFSHASQVNLPHIDLRSFDPLCQSSYQNMPVLTGDQALVGTCRCSTNMEVQGHLQLQGATLFVDGDLTVANGISGSGLLIVMGRTRVQQGIQLETSDRAVLLSAGPVVLTGVGARSSQFHGLVYTEGGFQAEQVSLVGAFISNGNDKPTVIRDSQLAYDRSVTQLGMNPGGSMLVPGSPANKAYATQAGQPGQTLSGQFSGESSVQQGQLVQPDAPTKYSTKPARGAWISAAGTSTGSAPTMLFDLSDFLGSSQPLEIISWRENP